MKNQGSCPKCGNRVLYVIDEATQQDPRFKNLVTPLSIAAAYVSTGEGGLFGDKQDMMKVTLEAWVCSKCGYSELYTRNLDVLAYLESQGAADVRIVDTSGGDQGPFR